MKFKYFLSLTAVFGLCMAFAFATNLSSSSDVEAQVEAVSFPSGGDATVYTWTGTSNGRVYSYVDTENEYSMCFLIRSLSHDDNKDSRLQGCSITPADDDLYNCANNGQQPCRTNRLHRLINFSGLSFYKQGNDNRDHCPLFGPCRRPMYASGKSIDLNQTRKWRMSGHGHGGVSMCAALCLGGGGASVHTRGPSGVAVGNIPEGSGPGREYDIEGGDESFIDHGG